MRVILRETLDNVGKAGEVVTVRDGYGRNYLLPHGLALRATERDVARLDHERRVITARAAKVAKDLQSQADALSKVSVSIARAVGEGEKLFGSVTTRDIAEALGEQGITVDSRKIQLGEPLKSLGTTSVSVKLARDATATITVSVVKKE